MKKERHFKASILKKLLIWMAAMVLCCNVATAQSADKMNLSGKTFEIAPFKFNVLFQGPVNSPNNPHPVSIGLINDGEYYWSIKTIEIPTEVEYEGKTYTVTEIMERGFEMIFNVESLTIPSSITHIQSYAFYKSGLREVIIPESVEKISGDAFDCCCNLLSFNVSPDNPNYVGEGSVLYNKDKTIIMWYNGAEGDLVIPEGITELGSRSFWYNNLNSITLPSSLKKIGIGAFFKNYTLREFICLAKTPPILTGDILTYEWEDAGTVMPTIYVPKESYTLYTEAPYWEDYPIYPIENSGLTDTLPQNEQSFEIYSINGRFIMRTIDSNYASLLENGLYIVNGKKTYIRR